MTTRRIGRGIVLLGSWLLVQVPAKDMKLSDPGHPMPPITQYKVVRQYDDYEQCEFARTNALQDAVSEGSDAMAAQASSLRCVQADQLTPSSGATPAATSRAP